MSAPTYRGQLQLAARAALDQLTGPERVEVIRHYLGSASKALRLSDGTERPKPNPTRPATVKW